ncbi:hypothetical protein E8E13_004552 [Curvularia kusanoi]|uniref:RING-type E3 ubiquitin transferase n=1 Tax=Curvularia kusanoi TaxID=90978 RepID=A0A9P4T7E8_CURKU|nr:hypothetical protein E8E13_004552 [Curvularia kusanoi]
MDPPTANTAHDGTEHSDGHRHLHGAVASHFLAQPHGGETWVDFLREGGNDPVRQRPQPNHSSTAPNINMNRPPSSSSSSPFALPSRPSPRADSPSSGHSSDRKRRLTTAESPLRRPSNMRMRSSSHASSSTNPIVLDSSPATANTSLRERPLPPPPSRRESDLVLPPWQPDSDVTNCPVCNRQFTFLFRKHHCRKCGRVVCSQCSPHRITIPRQFIVHPPSDGSNTIIDLTGDDDDANPMSSFGPFRNPALGGGEEVRVCNPCVPDPNYSLPPQYLSSASHAYGRLPPIRPEYSSGSHQRTHRQSSSVHVMPQTQTSRDSFSSRRVSYHDASQSEDRWPSPVPNSAYNHQQQHRTAPGSGSVRGVDMLPRLLQGAITQPPPIQQLNPRPRRQLAEEDECPICGGELPAKGPDGDDSARSQHVEECIALHSASPAPASTMRPQAQTSTSLPVTRTRGMSSAGNGEGTSSHRHSHAARGMFPYIATEKDCVDEDGNDAECIICFEEFEAGDKMARLVCWCKFHEKCIKDWWKMKGRGACPTHQLHEE